MNINDTFQYLNIGLPQDIARHKACGHLDEALRLIDLRLADEKTPMPIRSCMIAQQEMIRRQAENFPFNREQAMAELRAEVPDFTEAELDALLDANRINWCYLNGEMHFFNRFVSTLLKTDADFARRAGKNEKPVEDHNLIDDTIVIMKEKGSLAKRIRVRATLRVKDEHFVPGMFMRAHLPIPAACDQQSDIVIEKCFPENAQIAPEDAPQRTICWEENMQENHEFWVEYSYTHRSVWHDPAKITPSAEQPSFDTEEQQPHIVFTPYIRALVRELTEGVTDPLEKARRFYDFITKRMNYTFMPEYFTLESIAENCARNGIGDCGVFALLFITLCRCAGIPAQWQSGLCAEPDDCGAHDWARFYIAPYGWLWADPSFGVSANRNGKEERRQFYFTSQDPYRMVANRAFQKNFTVEKQHWRADPYDNQTGEMETTDRGLRYDEYDRTKETLMCVTIDD
ncbi:MAG: transglutaminase domain-containing protein [Clostridia bacterium]|nr:transglutaminase domain-containing protein [Clostridia bacterium]